MRWGIVPAAGAQRPSGPDVVARELLPAGKRGAGDAGRPRVVSEHLIERMVRAGVDRLCFIIGPGRSDLVERFGARIEGAHVCYVVQPQPAGLHDALFRALPFIRPQEEVLVGLPDTIWFPADGYCALGDGLSFLLFPVLRPERFDAVVTDAAGQVRGIEAKARYPSTRWIWGGFKLTGRILGQLEALHRERGGRDAELGELVNAWLARGGTARGVRAGEAYADVGTRYGYQQALQLLREREAGPEPGHEAVGG